MHGDTLHDARADQCLAWDNTLLLCRLRRQPQVPVQQRIEYAQAHVLHVMDCVLTRMRDDNMQKTTEIEQQQQSLLADQDPEPVQRERREQLVLCKRRARILHVMLQLLLCNGAPTSEFSIKATRYANARLAVLQQQVPPMQWDKCFPHTQ
jgi:hypothetical protein